MVKGAISVTGGTGATFCLLNFQVVFLLTRKSLVDEWVIEDFIF